jgi:hypothetical protein
MVADVIPIRPGVAMLATPPPLLPPPKVTPCPVCGLNAYPSSAEYMDCRDCAATMHSECYWGRVAPMSEWQAFFRWMDETPLDDLEMTDHPPVRCLPCRKAGT